MAGPLSGEKNEWAWLEMALGPYLLVLRVVCRVFFFFLRIVDLWTGYPISTLSPVPLSSSLQGKETLGSLVLGVGGPCPAHSLGPLVNI